MCPSQRKGLTHASMTCVVGPAFYSHCSKAQVTGKAFCTPRPTCGLEVQPTEDVCEKVAAREGDHPERTLARATLTAAPAQQKCDRRRDGQPGQHRRFRNGRGRNGRRRGAPAASAAARRAPAADVAGRVVPRDAGRQNRVGTLKPVCGPSVSNRMLGGLCFIPSSPA